MRRTYSILLSAGALLAVTAMPALAQANLAANRSTPTASARAADQWDWKPLGNYDVVLETPDRQVAVTITISESSGKLVALFWPAGDEEGQAMEATVIGADLVISANTRRGPIELNIERRGQTLSGTWMLGNKHGSLKGMVTS
jgi:hypothetical protein